MLFSTEEQQQKQIFKLPPKEKSKIQFQLAYWIRYCTGKVGRYKGCWLTSPLSENLKKQLLIFSHDN
jgi:hypothetical protein